MNSWTVYAPLNHQWSTKGSPQSCPVVYWYELYVRWRK